MKKMFNCVCGKLYTKEAWFKKHQVNCIKLYSNDSQNDTFNNEFNLDSNDDSLNVLVDNIIQENVNIIVSGVSSWQTDLLDINSKFSNEFKIFI